MYFSQHNVFFAKHFCQKLKRSSKNLRFFNTWPTHCLFRRFHAYLIISIVWSTSHWTNFTIFWTDSNFCNCTWNALIFT